MKRNWNRNLPERHHAAWIIDKKNIKIKEDIRGQVKRRDNEINNI